jgi:hypothetical protein
MIYFDDRRIKSLIDSHTTGTSQSGRRETRISEWANNKQKDKPLDSQRKEIRSAQNKFLQIIFNSL